MIPRSRGPQRAPRHRPSAPERRAPLEGAQDRWALWLLLLVHVALEAALVVAAWTFVKSLPALPLTAAQKAMFEIGFVAAFVVFGARGFRLFRRLARGGPATRR